MTRYVIVTLALLLCTIHSLTGTKNPPAIPFPDTRDALIESPLSACRYKKPFPFQCVLLVKKRLSGPPGSDRVAIFKGHLQPSGSSNNELPVSENRLFFPEAEESGAAFPFPFSARRPACSVERNVFHPPPAAA